MSDDFYRRQIERPLTYGDIQPRLFAWMNARYGFKQENDPMQISLNIREIANGVLVTVHRGGPFTEHDAPEEFYPNPEAAFAAAQDRLRLAWLDACERPPTKYDLCKLTDEREQFPNDPVMPEVATEKLPEERAAEGAGIESNTFNEDLDTSGYADTRAECDFDHGRAPIAADPAAQGRPAFVIGSAEPLPDQDDDQTGVDLPPLPHANYGDEPSTAD